MTVHLAEAVGVRRAREMSSTGNYIDAATALSWGLVNHVVAHEQLIGYCVALAADVATNDGAAVARLFRSYDEATELHQTAALLHEVDVAAHWMGEHPPESGEIARRRAEIVDRTRRGGS
jgi:enoyl-CoA hydratase